MRAQLKVHLLTKYSWTCFLKPIFLWLQIVKSPSILQTTWALAGSLTATLCKMLSQDQPAKLVPDSWPTVTCEVIMLIFKLINLVVIYYAAIDAFL